MAIMDRKTDGNDALALTRKLMGGAEGRAVPSGGDGLARLGQDLRYWLWRAGGRRRDRLKNVGHLSRLLDNYEIELERLCQRHARDMAAAKAAHDHAVKEIEAAQLQSLAAMRTAILAEADAATRTLRADLARERDKVARLEQLTAEFQRVYRQELAKAHAAGAAERDGEVAAALQRALDAETRMAEAELRWTREREEAVLAALDQAERAHATALAGLRTRHAEDLAEIRTTGEWALDEAKRQITDLRLKAQRQEENHAEAVAGLLGEHLANLARSRHEAEEERRRQNESHAEEQAAAQRRVTELETQAAQQAEHHAASLEELRREAATTLKTALEAEREEKDRLTARLMAEAETERQHLAVQESQWRAELATAQVAARAAAEEATELRERLAAQAEAMPSAGDEEEDSATIRRRLEEAVAELQSLRRSEADGLARLAAANAEAEQLRQTLTGERQAGQNAEAALRAELLRQAEAHTLALTRLRLDNSRRIAELERQRPQATPADPAPADLEDGAGDERDKPAETETPPASDTIEVLRDALALATAHPAAPERPGMGHSG